MEIRYKCKRCKMTVNAKVTLTAFKSLNYKGAKHNRLDCMRCGRYIKYIGQRELDKITMKIAEDGCKNRNKENKVTNEELNFKLDLILNHLGIRNETEIPRKQEYKA